MYPKGNFFIPAPHGQLEVIYRPETENARKVALVLHPHPLYGGTMHNKVVFRTARALQAAGYETLRFNFRGVGESTGVHDNGVGETDDARIALDYLLQKQPEAEQVVVAGFSFGSAVGLRLGCSDNRVHKIIAVGAPIKIFDPGNLSECRKPKLFVHGGEDKIAPLAPVKEMVEALPPEADAKLVVIEGAEHFFDGKLDELMEVVKNWA